MRIVDNPVGKLSALCGQIVEKVPVDNLFDFCPQQNQVLSKTLFFASSF